MTATVVLVTGSILMAVILGLTLLPRQMRGARLPVRIQRPVRRKKDYGND